MEAAAAVCVIQIAAIASAFLLSWRDRLVQNSLPYLVSVAVGVLLGTSVFHILPESMEHADRRQGIFLVFGGTILVLFAVERIFSALTGHAVETAAQAETALEECSEHRHHHHTPSTRPVNLIFGGMLHSFVDGVAVAAAFAVSRRVGWLTAFAITLHEVPHRLGDVALLLHLKVRTGRAMQLAALIGAPSLLGVVLVLLAARSADAVVWLLPVSAASFLYIAMVNLMPELAGERNLGRVALQLACVFGGAALVAGLSGLAG